MSKCNDNVLGDIRVLDLTCGIGEYAAKLYAQIGTEVIHVEPVTGDPLRQKGPFCKDQVDENGGLEFLYCNLGKKSLALDLSDGAGKQIFKKLCKTADVLIESFPPGYMDRLGLGYETLEKINSKLVYTAITPFGQTGPYSGYPFSDLTLMALGGFLFLAGNDDNKPVRAFGEQAFQMGASYAAIGSMIALYHARHTGEGQFIDVSMQSCVATALENSIQWYDLQGVNRRNVGVEAGLGIYRCKDGYVCIVAAFGKTRAMWETFLGWIEKDGAKDIKELKSEKWFEPTYRKTDEARETFKRIFEDYSRQRTKLYLYEESQKNRAVVFPVSNGKDIFEDKQFNYRKIFKNIYHPAIDTEVCFPTTGFEMSGTDVEITVPAPTRGQHSAEILKELGYSDNDIEGLLIGGCIYG
ncbi:CaiB/BaiF CoA transferase family protein [Desulfosarcina ovata]|uniref:Formyl-CoA transferase n=1 Tax=Desulfosarcina ovata subsp. ovata TaxID=2752305 RepID=A0A5K8A6T6_9BACT|nr:CoA transferase [Desulfosarcina ovata]BBO88108.1 formyl-CoA transferase [Desulfosarcina ovata subsp. ovata]